MPLKKPRFTRVVRMSSSMGKGRWGIHISSKWLEDQQILMDGERNPRKQTVCLIPKGKHAFLVSGESGIVGTPLKGVLDVDLLKEYEASSEDSEKILWEKLETAIHGYYLAGFSQLALRSKTRFSREIINQVRDLVQGFSGGDFVGQRNAGKSLILRFRGARVALRHEKGLYSKILFMGQGILEVLESFQILLKTSPEKLLNDWDSVQSDLEYIDWQEKFTDLSSKEIIRDCIYVTSILFTTEAIDSFGVRNEVEALAIHLMVNQLELFMDHLHQASLHLRRLFELEREEQVAGREESYLEVDKIFKQNSNANVGVHKILEEMINLFREFLEKQEEKEVMERVVWLLNLKIKAQALHSRCTLLTRRVEQILSPRVAIYAEGIVSNLERMSARLRKIILTDIDFRFGELTSPKVTETAST